MAEVVTNINLQVVDQSETAFSQEELTPYIGETPITKDRLASDIETIVPNVEDCYMETSGRMIRIIRRFRIKSISPSLAKLINTPPDPNMAKTLSDQVNSRFRTRYHTDEEFRQRRLSLAMNRRQKVFAESGFSRPKKKKILTEEERELRKLKLRHRYATDPEFRLKRRNQAKEAYQRTREETIAKVRERYRQDKEYASHKRETQRKRYSEDSSYALKCRILSRARYFGKKFENSDQVVMPSELRTHYFPREAITETPYIPPPQAPQVSIDTEAEREINPAEILSAMSASTGRHYQLEPVEEITEPQTVSEITSVITSSETVEEMAIEGEMQEAESQEIPMEANMVYQCPMEECGLELTSLPDLQTHFTDIHPEVMVMFKTV